ncbi:protein disulfide-isomerase domain protein [Cooperia oncophora]
MQWYTIFSLAVLPCCLLAASSLTVVIDLNEKFLDVSNEGFWIVKFYAPWCAHCKRLLPVWEHLGHAVNDKNLPVRVAKMDCTRFTSACNSLSISGYPTILFFRHSGRRIEYYGERSKEALFNFVVKSSAPVIEKISAARINDIKTKTLRNDHILSSFGRGGKDRAFTAEFRKDC